MGTLTRVAVFCGSSAGARTDYTNAASTLGELLAERAIGLVYGGARVGLMGRIAETVAQSGGEVIGVIPEALSAKEVAYDELRDLRVVRSMAERKAVMAELSDAFVALPGGFGTIDELVEMLTWTQLGFHDKPCGLLNTCGYYDALMRFVDHSVAERFVQPEHREMIAVEESPAVLIERLERYEPPRVDKTKWIVGLEDG